MVGEASFPVFREGAFPAESLGKFTGKRRERGGTERSLMAKKNEAGMTIAQIARTCHVSPATVSRVLYNRPYVAEEIRARVREEIRRCGYVFCHTSRMGKILVLAPAGKTLIHGEYYYSMFNALQSVFQSAGYETVAGRSSILPMLGNVGFDAVISLTSDDQVFSYWKDHLIAPLLYINWKMPPHADCFSIGADHRGALARVVDLLYRNGHRKIGFLGVGFEIPDNQRPWEEREGFLQAMRRKMLLSSAFLEYTNDQEPHQALTNLLRRGITALICPSITEGAKIARILQDLRWRIPEDISLVVGDSEFSNPVNTIPLTAMRMPYEKIAECCCSVVRKRIPPTLEIEYEIVERESVGPVPGKG